jgi:hypothetical protein
MNDVDRLESDPIGLFMPWIEESERLLRRRLLRARNLASASACRCRSDQARTLYWMVDDAAAKWVLAPAHAGDLKALVDSLARLVTVAGTFEQLEAADGD